MHQHSAGATSFYDEAIGKSVADNSTKLQLVVDACDNSVGIDLTGGQVLDSNMANVLINATVTDFEATIILACVFIWLPLF